MREILFRAIRKDKKEWVYGVPVYSVNDIAYMIHGATEDAINTDNQVDFYFTEVIPETVGQYIGSKDMSGNNIFEGDVLPQRYYHNNPPSKRPKKKFIDVNRPVVYKWSEFILDYFDDVVYGTTYNFRWNFLTIAGNIHDNPELLVNINP
jgi:uncharacterized phage protein (TIGR01671 family)